MRLPDGVYAALGDTHGVVRAAVEAHDIEHLDFDPDCNSGEHGSSAHVPAEWVAWCCVANYSVCSHCKENAVITMLLGGDCADCKRAKADCWKFAPIGGSK